VSDGLVCPQRSRIQNQNVQPSIATAGVTIKATQTMILAVMSTCPEQLQVVGTFTQQQTLPSAPQVHETVAIDSSLELIAVPKLPVQHGIDLTETPSRRPRPGGAALALRAQDSLELVAVPKLLDKQKIDLEKSPSKRLRVAAAGPEVPDESPSFLVALAEMPL